MIERDIKIEGMSCGHCVSAVEKLVNETEGVESSNVSLPDNAVVVFDETKITIEDLKEIINNSEIYKAL